MITYTVVKVVNVLFNILEIAILIECISSWIPQMRSSQFINLVKSFTYPVLEPCRRLQERLMPGFAVDFSPIIALLAMDIIRKLIVGIIL